MAVDIGPKIGIDGEAQFRRELQEINQGLKTLSSEAKAVEATMRDETDAEKKLAAQKDVLNRQIQSQKEKLEKLEEGLQQAGRKFGEADTRTQKWKQAVYDATAELGNMEKGLKDLDKGVDDNTESLEEAEKATAGWADVFCGTLLADAVKGGISKLAGWVSDAASALWDASKAGAAYADEMLTLSATSGLSTERLQEYSYMADLIDVSLDTVTGSLTKVTKSMSAAAKGEGDAYDAFKNLNVEVKDQNGQLRKAEDVFNDVIDALGKIDNETERDAKAMTVLGKSAKELNPMIKAGSKQMKALAQEAHDTGYVLSGSALTALGKQQDAMDRFAKKTEAVSNSFAERLAPSVEKVYGTLNDTLDNPRTQRALDVLADGVGNVISTLGDIAASAIPTIVEAFGIFDSRIALYSDDQLKRIDAMDKLSQSWDGLKSTFEEDAGAIWEEHQKADGLWKKLQDVTSETGEVKKGNEELANYIANELNEKLGTNIQVIDGVIQGWQGVKKEIDEVITRQTAQALLAARQEQYAEALAKQKEAGSAAAATFKDLTEAKEAEADAMAKLNKLQEEGNDVIGYTLDGMAIMSEDYNTLAAELSKASELVKDLTEDYEEQSTLADELMATTESYSKALAAQAEGDYQAVIDYTTKGYSLERDYIEKQGELKEQEVLALKKKYDEQSAYVDWYEQQLAEKKAGYSEEGLKAAKKEQVRLLNAVSQGWTDIYNETTKQAKKAGDETGKQYGAGVVRGLDAYEGQIYEAAKKAAKQITGGMRNELAIASPSKKGVWIGEMWDEGLIKGMESMEEKIFRTAGGLADTISAASYPGAAQLGTASYSSGAITQPIGADYGGAGGGARAYTTNMGGISVIVQGAGAVNEDALAQRVAVRLTEQLRRTQRGGRA